MTGEFHGVETLAGLDAEDGIGGCEEEDAFVGAVAGDVDG